MRPEELAEAAVKNGINPVKALEMLGGEVRFGQSAEQKQRNSMDACVAAYKHDHPDFKGTRLEALALLFHNRVGRAPKGRQGRHAFGWIPREGFVCYYVPYSLVWALGYAGYTEYLYFTPEEEEEMMAIQRRARMERW